MFTKFEVYDMEHPNAAILETYDFPKNATESDIVARIFKMC